MKKTATRPRAIPLFDADPPRQSIPRPTAPDGSALSRKHVAHFLDTLRWAGVMLEDRGGRLMVRGDRGGLLQAEVTRREGAIRAWWKVTGEAGHDAR